MEISKEEKNLVIKIPLWQPSYDAIHEYIGDVHNVVGVIVNGKDDDSGIFEQGIYQLNDLEYKDDIQLGMPILMTYMEDDEFRKLCGELGIDIWEYPSCKTCGKTLFGTHTINSKGESCMEHEEKIIKEIKI